uniref:Uncharacterized protein n=1 Tax=Aegilops tauschii TaxID=37682 RepID=N1QZM1_AEGTA
MAPAPVPLLVAAFSLLFAAATPIRDVADACSSQVQVGIEKGMNYKELERRTRKFTRV